MINKYSFNLFLGFICLSYVSGYRIEREAGNVEGKPELDDLDRTTIKETGCKSLILGLNETVLFTSTSALDHTTMAKILSDVTLRDQNQTYFETHFAIRAEEDVRLEMFSRRQYYTPELAPLGADFVVGFDASNVKKTFLMYHLHYMEYASHSSSFQDFLPLNFITPDKYEKFYVTLDGENFRFGRECKKVPVHTAERVTMFRQQQEIVQFGFTSRSPNGAKILYDCPPDFAGCKCGLAVFD